jgi:hypothetical protein
MSYDLNDEDIESIEIIDPGKATHKSEVVSNVVYSAHPNKGNAKKTTKAGNNEAFYKWMRSLNSNSEERREEISYSTSIKDINPAGKKRIVY